MWYCAVVVVSPGEESLREGGRGDRDGADGARREGQLPRHRQDRHEEEGSGRRCQSPPAGPSRPTTLIC